MQVATTTHKKMERNDKSRTRTPNKNEINARAYVCLVCLLLIIRYFALHCIRFYCMKREEEVVRSQRKGI